MGKLNVGKIAPDAGHDFPPQTRALQYVRLLDRKHPPPAGPRQFKCDAGDALDFTLAITHGVHRLALAGFSADGAWLTEIQSAKQFAHDQDVRPSNDFLAQRRAPSQRRIKNSRTKIGECAKLLP